jgi:hypothetical protein
MRVSNAWFTVTVLGFLGNSGGPEKAGDFVARKGMAGGIGTSG